MEEMISHRAAGDPLSRTGFRPVHSGWILATVIGIGVMLPPFSALVQERREVEVQIRYMGFALRSDLADIVDYARMQDRASRAVRLATAVRYDVTVDARGETRPDIQLSPGDDVEIVASGIWSISPKSRLGPRGFIQAPYRVYLLVDKSAPVASLIAYLDEPIPTKPRSYFCVGAGYQFRPDRPGRIVFRCNELDDQDNAGSLSVHVYVWKKDGGKIQ